MLSINYEKLYTIYGYFACLANPAVISIPDSTQKLLYVCKGNVCRSPIAEYISRKITLNSNLNDLKFSSRGIEVLKNSPAEGNAILVCKKNGIDMTKHRSTPLNEEDIYDNDIILTMNYRQLVMLHSKYPAHIKKIRLLPIFSKKKILRFNDIMINDPYGCPIAEFEHCYGRIYKSVLGLLEAIRTSRETGVVT